jgi:O-antigen/teichoic acid export membrane protein
MRSTYGGHSEVKIEKGLSSGPIVSSIEASASMKGKVIKQSAYVFAAQVAGLACGLLSNFLVAWMLGPAGRGSFYLVQLIASLGQVFLNCGLGPAAVYYLQRDKRYSDSQVRSTILWSSVVLGVLPMMACGLAWPLLAKVVFGKLSPALFWVALASIPGMVVSWNVSYLSLARGSTTSFNILRTAPSLLFLLFLILMVGRHDYSPIGVAISWLASTSITAGLAPVVVRKIANQAGSEENGFLRNAAGFGFRSHLGAVTQYLQHRIDAVLVGFFCSLRDVGIFSLAVSIAELLWYLPNTVANVLISHVAESSEEAGARLTASFCRATLALTAVLAALLAAVGVWAIPVILPAFSYSSHLLCVLLPGTVSVVIFKILSSDLNGRGRPLETFRPAAISLAACFAAGLIVIPRFGIMAAAIVTSAGYVLNAALCLRRYSAITAVPMRDLLLLRYTDIMMMRNLWRQKRAARAVIDVGGLEAARQCPDQNVV